MHVVELMSVKEQNCADTGTVFDDLPDAILVFILSRLRLKDAARTSVLSHRWRHLWTFTSGSLDFDDCGTVNGHQITKKKFIKMVNRVIRLHQALQVDTFMVHVNWQPRQSSPRFLDKWICHAMKKGAKTLEIQLGPIPNFGQLDEWCELPNLDTLLTTRSFASLKILKLADLCIHEETIHCFLASCKNLECLSLQTSYRVKNLQVIDPFPKLKSIEIIYCLKLRNLEISVASLVSFTFYGYVTGLPLKKVPNLSKVCLAGRFCESFLFEADKHLSYSSQLESLELLLPRDTYGIHDYVPDLPQYCSLKQLKVIFTPSGVGQSLLFFTILIKACPFLNEFIMSVQYANPLTGYRGPLYPQVSAAEAPVFDHEYLKLIEFMGYIGASKQDELLIYLFNITHSLERVVIDTRKHHHNMSSLEAKIQACRKSTRFEAKEYAEQLRSKIPSRAELVIK